MSKKIIGWVPEDVHADAYVGYPDVQDSILQTKDTGGVAALSVGACVEVAE